MTDTYDENFEKEQGESKEDTCLLEKSRKYTKIQWFTICTLAFGNFCVGGSISLQAPFFPEEAEAKGATPTEYGFIFGIFQLTIFVTAPLMAKLIGYVECKALLNAGILSNGLSCIMFGFLEHVYDRTTFVVLGFVFRALEGLSGAAVRTSAYAIIASQFSENTNTAFATIETFLGFGLIIGPTVGGALYDLGGFGLPFYVVGLLFVVDAITILLILPKAGRSAQNTERQILKFWMHPSTLVHASAIFIAFNYIGYNQATLEPHIRQFHLSGMYIGLLFAIAGATYAISAPCWGQVCDKKLCNLHLITVIGYLLTSVSLILIGPMPFLKLENGITTLIIALILMGIGVSALVVPSFAGSLQVTERRGFPSGMNTYALTSSMIASSQSLGAFIGPSVGGYLLDKEGYNFGTFVNLILTIVFFCLHLLYAIVCKWQLFQKAQSMEKKPILEMEFVDRNGISKTLQNLGER